MFHRNMPHLMPSWVCEIIRVIFIQFPVIHFTFGQKRERRRVHMDKSTVHHMLFLTVWMKNFLLLGEGQRYYSELFDRPPISNCACTEISVNIFSFNAELKTNRLNNNVLTFHYLLSANFLWG